MGYGHADKIAKDPVKPPDGAVPAARKATTPGDIPALPVAPEWYARPELHPVLTGHDIGALFCALGEIGITQRQIARLTGRFAAQHL